MSATPIPTTTGRDPDLDKDIHLLIREVVPYFVEDAAAWMAAPNPHLDMASPADVIGTEREAWLRDMLRAAKQGAFS